jgi:hypothetical protein
MRAGAALRSSSCSEWVTTNRAGLLAIGERHEQIGQPSADAMHGDETGDVIAPVPDRIARTRS